VIDSDLAGRSIRPNTNNAPVAQPIIRPRLNSEASELLAQAEESIYEADTDNPATLLRTLRVRVILAIRSLQKIKSK
jgi:hypothetical protein